MNRLPTALIVALGVFALTPLVRAAGDPAADLQALQAAAAAKTPADLTTGSARYRWSVKQGALVHELAEKFMVDYPTDPRRWEAALIIFAKPRAFPKSINDALMDQQRPGTIVRGAIEYDDAAREKHQQHLAALEARCEAANDMTPEVRKKYLLGAAGRQLTQAGVATTQKKPVDLAALRARIDRLIAAYPDADEVGISFDRHVSLYRRGGAGPEEVVALLQQYADSPHAKVRGIAETGLTMHKAKEKPLDWKFTAADGREVDLVKLRGKVVLIDFWATWCKPCVAEIPHLKDAYAKYHAKGLEIVGISLEMAGVAPDATPEQAAPKLAAAKKKLLDFVAKNDLPWPQFYDGTGWKNPYTTKYGIRGIPAMFLLDREGRVVSMDARGEKLDRQVQALLER
jgi:thiol-disulfide isomerase/thioredoxin